MRTYIKNWGRDYDCKKEPEIIKTVKSLKKGDMFQAVENLHAGPILFASSGPYKIDEKKWSIKTDTSPF